jgi:hypothetical protein
MFSRGSEHKATNARTDLRPPFPRPPPQFWVQTYEKEARKNWDIFYKNNQDKFFKDRH